MSESFPVVIAAVFCEKVLAEADKVLSAIRIVDRVFANALWTEGQPPTVTLTMMVLLKGNGYRGKAQLQVIASAPNGDRASVLANEIEFSERPNEGANVLATVGFTARMAGVYWFEVLLNNRVATRTPLDVVVGESARK
jgi:hypothetical protein